MSSLFQMARKKRLLLASRARLAYRPRLTQASRTKVTALENKMQFTSSLDYVIACHFFFKTNFLI